MKKYILLFIFLGALCSGFAQNKPYLKELKILDTKRIHLNQTGMIGLGSWAVGNMATFGALRFNADGVNRHFYNFNIGWNVVNLGLATASYFGAKKEMNQQRSVSEMLQSQNQIRNILLFNAGLDLGYVAAGGWMMAASHNKANPDRWQGYGQGLILQGAFLFLFDATLYYLHTRNSHKMYDALERMEFTGNGVSWRF